MLENLSTLDLTTYVKDRMAAGRAVFAELLDALKELKSRCKDEGVWHATILECGIKPGTWRQWEFRELNQLTTGKRTGSRNVVARSPVGNPERTAAANNLAEAKEQFGKAAADGNEQAAAIIADYEKELADATAGDEPTAEVKNDEQTSTDVYKAFAQRFWQQHLLLSNLAGGLCSVEICADRWEPDTIVKSVKELSAKVRVFRVAMKDVVEFRDATDKGIWVSFKQANGGRIECRVTDEGTCDKVRRVKPKVARPA
jgi:hypothetical protein